MLVLSAREEIRGDYRSAERETSGKRAGNEQLSRETIFSPRETAITTRECQACATNEVVAISPTSRKRLVLRDRDSIATRRRTDRASDTAGFNASMRCVTPSFLEIVVIDNRARVARAELLRCRSVIYLGTLAAPLLRCPPVCRRE